MENTLNNLISIDEECKRNLKEVQDKQDNIEYLVNEELTKRKDEIKTKYKFKIDMRKNEYEMKLLELKQIIELKKKQIIEKIKKKYEEEKQKMIEDLIRNIL